MWNVKRKVQTFSTTLLERAGISAKLKIKIFTPNVYIWNVGLGVVGMKWVWGKLQFVTGIIYHKTDIEYTWIQADWSFLYRTFNKENRKIQVCSA